MSKYSENMPPSLQDAIGWMADYIQPNKMFLDFGCSTGYFGALIKEAKHNKVYGVEISDDREQAAKVLDGVYSFDLDGEWPKEIYEHKYDYLFYGDVLEHLKDPGLALEKSKALLRKGGLIFISTPNVAHISIRLELLSGNFDYEPMGILDNTHLKYFTKKSLTQMIEGAGYRIKAYSFSANDYPDTTIKKLLAKAGVTATDKFWKLANAPEARAFQHKAVIEVANGKVSAVAAKEQGVNTEKPEATRNAMYKDLQQQVKNLQAHAKEQAKIIEHYVERTKRLEAQTQPLRKRAINKLRNKSDK